MENTWGNSNWGNNTNGGAAASWGNDAVSGQGKKNEMIYDGSAIGFDDAISFSGNSYIVLKPGEYEFTVKSFERGYFNGNEKSPPCPTVKMNFEVETPDGNTTVMHTFFLRKWESAIDQIYNFFVSIGIATVQQRENKVPIIPKWNESVGRKGRFEIKNATKVDDKNIIYNNVKKFIDPR